LDEVIESLPRGWETRIGEHGVRLSGGQRQRLALARAFLCDAPILVFDEATSMFDPSAQRRFVQRNLDLLDQKTVVWVTHGEAGRGIADRIVEIHGGRLRAPLHTVEERRA
jgi:ATP-binding cassette subfamily B protein/subfamily B ATP-binding cassette protein MsbA